MNVSLLMMVEMMILGILKGRYPDLMSSGEIGCTTSHLKAIKHWLETSDSSYAIIMEDDCSLETVQCWNFTWDDFIAYTPMTMM